MEWPAKELLILRLPETESAPAAPSSDEDRPLSAESMKRLKKSAKSLKNEIKKSGSVRTICCSPHLAGIQAADIFHDEISVKLRVVRGLAERQSGESPLSFEERAKRALEQALAFPEPVLFIVQDDACAALLRAVGVGGDLETSVSYRLRLSEKGWELAKLTE